MFGLVEIILAKLTETGIQICLEDIHGALKYHGLSLDCLMKLAAISPSLYRFQQADKYLSNDERNDHSTIAVWTPGSTLGAFGRHFLDSKARTRQFIDDARKYQVEVGAELGNERIQQTEFLMKLPSINIDYLPITMQRAYLNFIRREGLVAPQSLDMERINMAPIGLLINEAYSVYRALTRSRYCVTPPTTTIMRDRDILQKTVVKPETLSAVDVQFEQLLSRQRTRQTTLSANTCKKNKVRLVKRINDIKQRMECNPDNPFDAMWDTTVGRNGN